MPFEDRKWTAMIDDDLVLRAKAFVNSVEAGEPPAAIEAFYHPDIVQEEYPNLLLPNGAVRRFDDLRAANEKARSILRSQRFEIINAVRSGDHVALESLGPERSVWQSAPCRRAPPCGRALRNSSSFVMA